MNSNRKYYIELTKREEVVINLIALGNNNKRIADIMAVSCHTIKAFVASILRKLDAKNRTHAVYKAFAFGILSKHSEKQKLKSA